METAPHVLITDRAQLAQIARQPVRAGVRCSEAQVRPRTITLTFDDGSREEWRWREGGYTLVAWARPRDGWP